MKMKAFYWKYKLSFNIKISSYIKMALLSTFSQNGISRIVHMKHNLSRESETETSIHRLPTSQEVLE